MRPATRRAVPVLLVLLAVLAAQRTGLLDGMPGSEGTGGDGSAPGSASVAGPAEAPVPLPARERYTVIGERPLFMPTRRPPDPPPPPRPLATPRAPAPPPPPAGLEVHAIVREGDRWLAILGRSGGGELVQAEPGDQAFGWTVIAIEAEGVELESGARRLRLRLRPEVDAPQ